MKLIPLLVLLSVGLTGCSGSKSAQSVNQDTPQIELSDADEFVENPNEEPIALAEPSEAPLAADEGLVTEEPIVADSPIIEENLSDAPMEAIEPPKKNQLSPAPQVAAAPEPMMEAPEAAPVMVDSSMGGSEKTYTVQKNETLMMVAFKLYGDYRKWKELANYNRSTLRGSTSLSNGMKIKYMAPAEEFVWNPQGLPYLIRTGDTLGLISNSVYQTPKKWKSIWDNNRPLIKDPNRIFAGFTLYYLESGREVAAEL